MIKEKLKEWLPIIVFASGVCIILICLIMICTMSQENAEREAEDAEIDEKLKLTCLEHCESIGMKYYSMYSERTRTNQTRQLSICRCLNNEHEIIIYRPDNDGILIKRGI